MYAFYNCVGLETVSISNSVLTIEDYAFQYCSNIKSLTIPNSVCSIGKYAFFNCKNITSLFIGEKTTTINTAAFKNCTALSNVTNYSEYPQNIDNTVFSGVEIKNCFLYVGEGSYEYYKSAEHWKDFIVQIAGVEGVEVDGTTKEVEGYYDLKGVRLEEPACGQVNIVRYTDGTAKKIVIE